MSLVWRLSKTGLHPDVSPSPSTTGELPYKTPPGETEVQSSWIPDTIAALALASVNGIRQTFIEKLLYQDVKITNPLAGPFVSGPIKER